MPLKNLLYLLCLVFCCLAAKHSCAQLPGSLDSTFGNGGIVTTLLPDSAETAFTRSALQLDGKYLVTLTYRMAPDTSLTLTARYLPNGSLDSGWGENGLVISRILSATNLMQPRNILVQSDEKVLLFGRRDTFVFNPPPIPITNSPFMIRYLSDGKLDSLFGINGMLTPYYEANVVFRGATIRGNRILVFGNDFDSTRIHAFKLNDGQVDSTFGQNGVKLYDLPGPSAHQRIVNQGQNILLFEEDGYLYRFLPNGDLDSTFGVNGQITSLHITGEAGASYAKQSIKVLSSQKILLGGLTDFGEVNEDKGFIERYHPNGTLDTSFADNGVALVDFGFYTGSGNPLNNGGSGFYDMGVQSDGKIIASGHVLNSSGSDYSVVARYDSTGQLDTTFGNNGIVAIDIHPNDSIEFTFNVHVQPDNKIVQTGFTRLYSQQTTSTRYPSTINLVRYHGDSVITSTTQAPPTPQSTLDFFPNPIAIRLLRL